VILATDYIGARPLYYSSSRNATTWSASLRELARRCRATALDENYVRHFITGGAPASLTPYRGIGAVPPGHAVELSASATTILPLWTEPTEPLSYRDEQQYDEQLVELFREAVAARLNRSGPMMAELSGGLDSSSVVAMGARLIESGQVSATSLDTVSYLYPESIDAPFINAVEGFCGVRGHRLSLREVPVFSESHSVGATPDDACPVHDALMQLVDTRRAGGCLTGQGGDLLFGNHLGDAGRIAGLIQRREFAGAAAEAWSIGRHGRTSAVRLISMAIVQSCPMLSRFVPNPHVPSPSTASLRGTFLDRTAPSVLPAGMLSGRMPAMPLEESWRLQAFAIGRHFGVVRPNETIAAIRYSHPILHRPLVEFLLRVPAAVLCRPNEPRRLMRRALKFLWPAALVGRRSKGLFTLPNHDAFRPLCEKLLRQRTCQVVERGWVDRGSLRQRLLRFSCGLDCGEFQLRQILLLESWLRSGPLSAGQPA
jgi:asparagine synthase (glutamine-hydrolysing)